MPHMIKKDGDTIKQDFFHPIDTADALKDGWELAPGEKLPAGLKEPEMTPVKEEPKTAGGSKGGKGAKDDANASIAGA